MFRAVRQGTVYIYMYVYSSNCTTIRYRNIQTLVNVLRVSKFLASFRKNFSKEK